jgi:hypothetical protein
MVVLDRRTASLLGIKDGWKKGKTNGKTFGKRSPEFCAKMSEVKRGKPMSEKQRQSLIGVKRGMYGKQHSEEAKKRMSNASKGKHKSLEHCLKLSEKAKNKIHITDGVVGKKIKCDEQIPNGWFRGRPTKGKKVNYPKTRKSRKRNEE